MREKNGKNTNSNYQQLANPLHSFVHRSNKVIFVVAMAIADADFVVAGHAKMDKRKRVKMGTEEESGRERNGNIE